MKCYYHSEADAVGICKSCNRGLCSACAAEVGEGIACAGRCEETVAQINGMISRSSASYHIVAGIYRRSAGLFLVSSLAFLALGWALARAARTAVPGYMLLLLGLFFLLSCVSYFKAANSYSQGQGVTADGRDEQK